MDSPRWVVHKFGGTSVANASRYQQVARILADDAAPHKAIVLSAMSGVTDALLELVDLAVQRDDAVTVKLDALRQRHHECLDGLLPAADAAPVKAVIDTDTKHLGEILRGVWHARFAPELTRELVSGHGELWSAQLFHAYLRSLQVEADWLDARSVLVVTPGERTITVDWPASQAKLDPWLATHASPTLVVAGFVASTPEGIATTLKRDGSDFSASIFGKLLKASAITIWTDVDGVLTADPRLVPGALTLEELSYAEATELAYFGAKVVHPSTMAPAIADGIPIWIRNAFRPERKGTKIHAGAQSDRPVRGLAAIGDIALFNIEGTGMVGVPGISERLFGALREVDVSVVMISQASSEHSICFAIPELQAEIARRAIERAFYAELHQGQIESVSLLPRCGILAIVGDNMVHRPGVAGAFLGALGRAGVNVRAIAQGSSERNISVVVAGDEQVAALRAAHSAFLLAPQTISIGLVGCGRVGAAFLAQLEGIRHRLFRESTVDLRVRGVLTSKTMLLSDEPISLERWTDAAAGKTPADPAAFFAHVRADHLPHAALVDLTASEEPAAQYPDWLTAGFHVITPNKKAGSGPLSLHHAIRRAAREKGCHFLYETTVGGGLPLLRTLRDLVRTGDRVRQIEGVLSGTLSFLFNRFDGSVPFSRLVRDAHAMGYTEPDPRDDLSGADVARKLVILARECGLEPELSSVTVENLVPEGLRAGSVAQFLDSLPAADGEWEARLAAARADGRVLRHAGRIDEHGQLSVGLEGYPEDHPFAQLSGADNVVTFSTDRYHPQPLIVRGPGAGPEVTAAGVLADVLRLASYLGAKL